MAVPTSHIKGRVAGRTAELPRELHTRCRRCAHRVRASVLHGCQPCTGVSATCLAHGCPPHRCQYHNGVRRQYCATHCVRRP
eukprot:1131339-Rhodomonas_salina.4